ncbi:hypothetical protein O6H91_15G051800 [Diphasiastrum complanatum]|uniref:Uncharacterized protein n=2 Tax=Diphasiastrum complanatum TaxID=34168 RepID=A0ACC2BI81_DIPCM|nr:hypothetical protein O6H91_15G051500 [Diphasiastrum complanatum]KAJ7529468.1 hypothetical protein O6H91_15G051800 [Diphasiastrum complanatum]
MWLLLVAAGSGYLIRCYHKALHANTPVSDSKESATTAGTPSNTSSSFQTDTIRSLPPRSDASDEGFQSEVDDLPGEIDKSDELLASRNDVLKIDKEYKGNCGKYLDWGSIEKRCGPMEPKFTASTDWRNRNRVFIRQAQKEVRGKYASSTLMRASKNFQIDSTKELHPTGNSDFHDNVASTSQRVAEDGADYVEASDAFLPKPLNTGNDCHHAEPITNIERHEIYAQDACLETPSESEAKASLVLFPTVDFDKRTLEKQRHLFVEKESEERSVEISNNCPPFNWKRRKGVNHRIEEIAREEANQLFLQTQGLVGSLLGALLFSFGVGVGLFHMLFSCKFNDASQSHTGILVQGTRPDYGAGSSLEPNNRLSFQATNEQYLSLGNIAYDEKTEDLEAELQAELEFLHTSFADKGSSEQQRELLDISDLSLDWTIGSGDSQAISEFHENFCTEEAKDHSAQIVTQNQAVSPWELDRRLRILLESRQEERISELEAEVNALLEKLRMKDQELQIWKDRLKPIILATQASTLGNWIGVKRTIPIDKVTAGGLDEEDTSLGNVFYEENEYSETCESWPSCLNMNLVDETETLTNIPDKASTGDVHNMSAVCGSILGSKEAMVTAGCCSSSSSNCSSPCQRVTVGDFGDWSIINDGAVRYLFNVVVNTNESEENVMCTVTDESRRAITNFDTGKLHASTSDFLYDRLNRSNEELIISRHNKTTVDRYKAKSEAFLACDPSNVSSSCLEKGANSKTDALAHALVGSLQKSNRDHLHTPRNFDRQPSSMHSTDVKDFAANKGESRCPSNDAFGCITNFPLVWEESLASNDSQNHEFIMPIVESKRKGSKMSKDDQLIMSMLEEDEQGSIGDTEIKALVHLSKAMGGDDNFGEEEHRGIFGSKGCNYAEPSCSGMLPSLRENVEMMNTRGEIRDILEEFFASEDFKKFKSTIE